MEAIVTRLEGIPSRLEGIPSRLEGIPSRLLEAISSRLEAIAISFSFLFPVRSEAHRHRSQSAHSKAHCAMMGHDVTRFRRQEHRVQQLWGSVAPSHCKLQGTFSYSSSLLLVAMPGAPSSVRSLLVVRPGAPSSLFMLLFMFQIEVCWVSSWSGLPFSL